MGSFRRQLSVLGACVMVLACKSDPEPNEGQACGDAPACLTSLSCDPGYYCEKTDAEEGCCVESTACNATSCSSGQYCDYDTGSCTDVATACVTYGCACFVVDAAGGLSADGSTPQITLAAGATRQLQVVLTIEGGSPLPSGGFSFSSDDDDVATVDTAGVVTAGATADVATISVVGAGGLVDCAVDVRSLGAPSSDSVLRVYSYNDRTGAPEEDVTIVVQEAGTATELASGSTLANGTLELGSVSGNYTVTAFKAGFNYVSLVGLSFNDTKDIVLPLSPRDASPEVGGMSGRFDFRAYEQRFLAGPKLAQVGLAAGSIPLHAILNFDLSLFIGDLGTDCDAASDSAPVAGCYKLENLPIPGIDDTYVPMPPNITLGAGTPVGQPSNIKSNFDAVSPPGRRFAWGLGGEGDVGDLTGVISEVLSLVSCNDNCPQIPSLDFQVLIDDIMPLLGQFAIAVRGDQALEPIASTEWDSFVATNYAERVPWDDRVPRFDGPIDDGDTHSSGRLDLREGMRNFTDIAAPAMPDDPGQPGQKLEGMLVLTGKNAPGYGFVPLGLGGGLDCTTDVCLFRNWDPSEPVDNVPDYLDRIDAAQDDFDGVPNRMRVCIPDPDPSLNRCPKGYPADGFVGPGSLALFHATPYNGLETGQWLTLVGAAPISSLVAGGTNGAYIRATVFLRDDAPVVGGADWSSNAFPAFPAFPSGEGDEQAGRVYTAQASPDAAVQWVTFAADADGDDASTRWNVYFVATGETFNAPAVPSGSFEDPFAGEALDPASPGDLTVSVTHVGFQLKSSSGQSLASMAANNGNSLADIVQYMSGFSVQSRNVPLQ